jgi:NYN domain
MRRESGDTFLSAVFVDYDNIYLSLKRKNDDAAKRFAKDAPLWLKAIETGELITPTNGTRTTLRRRMVMNRCYGNPVPRRNTGDNATDMNSFPFVRHHFLRSGFEIIDCPPLTAQLKNSADIRMVMDVRDYLGHDTHFDEFVILSGDADFTPVLHRLRAHARRTVVYANEFTAAPYTAICDGEVREADLLKLLLQGNAAIQDAGVAAITAPDHAMLEGVRREIMADVTTAVRTATAPVPLEVLADRAVRNVGHDKTVGTSWAGAGNFRDLLAQALPEGLIVSAEPPYVVVDASRHRIVSTAARPASLPAAKSAPQETTIDRMLAPQVRMPHVTPANAFEAEPAVKRANPAPSPKPQPQQPPAQHQPAAAAPRREQAQLAQRPVTATATRTVTQNSVARPAQQQARPAAAGATAGRDTHSATLEAAPAGYAPVATQPAPQRARQAEFAEPSAQLQPSPPKARTAEGATSAIHQSIARIHEACQAPPLSPPEYRVLFEVMAIEINENGLTGAQTIQNISQRALERGIEVRRDDARFALEVVSEADPWFEQGATANLFAGRFRNFVVARCRSQGLNLSADELDLIEAWFAGNAPMATARAPVTGSPGAGRAPVASGHMSSGHEELDQGRRGEGHMQARAPRQEANPLPYQEAPSDPTTDDFPRIVRTRLRG